MSSETEKKKHSKRLKTKVKAKARRARVRSVTAKDLITSGKFSQRIVVDKRGKKRDLKKMDFRDLVEAMQDNGQD